VSLKRLVAFDVADDDVFIFCTQCGKKNPVKNAFCTDCGAKMVIPETINGEHKRENLMFLVRLFGFWRSVLSRSVTVAPSKPKVSTTSVANVRMIQSTLFLHSILSGFKKICVVFALFCIQLFAFVVGL
jgi:hypothetical protein